MTGKEIMIKEETSLMPQSDLELERRVKSAERYMELQDKIRKMAILVTNQNDWVDQNGNPYLEISGANKIASAFGVSCASVVFEKETLQDDIGEYIIYSCSSSFSWNNREISEVGTASTRDAFFGKTKEGFKPLSEIDLTNIKKKAHTNLLNRGIKNLLGLSYTWDEIEKISGNRINRKNVSSVSYSKGSKGGTTETAETKNLRTEIGRMLLEMADNDKGNAALILEQLTKWTDKTGKEVPGKTSVLSLTEKQLTPVYSKVKVEYKNYLKERGLADDSNS